VLYCELDRQSQTTTLVDEVSNVHRLKVEKKSATAIIRFLLKPEDCTMFLHGNGQPFAASEKTDADAKSIMPDLKISAKM
jgi:hypothetical protein